MPLKLIYRRDGWILGVCTHCGRTNYVEPHGRTAPCACSEEWTEHDNIAHTYRDVTGCIYQGPSRIPRTKGGADAQR